MDVYIGIDSGGTYTRALCADLSGRVLAYAEGAGGNPDHNRDAQDNLRGTVDQALAQAGVGRGDVRGLVAGLAGLDHPEDKEWADEMTAMPGLDCPRLNVNDTDVALAGAFELGPGILSIASSGTNTVGMTDNGEMVGNYYHFCHYASSSARHLGFDAVFQILIGEATPADSGFIDGVLAHFDVPDVIALRALARTNRAQDWRSLIRRYAKMGPLVTSAASGGAPLARHVCDGTIEQTVVAIRLVGGCFAAETVPLVLHGAVANSDYIRQGVLSRLAQAPEKRYADQKPALPPAHGAVLMAACRLGRARAETIVANLKEAAK